MNVAMIIENTYILNIFITIANKGHLNCDVQDSHSVIQKQNIFS